ncbi:MAG: glycosyltransferase [Chitinophagaceae bacterium]|nr:MAG: glycosyltransferase [Chitinophagaceae bacterium]
MPVVSVILPVYNAEAYLKEAIDSILAQTFADFELLVINDGSTDDSESIINAYTDERIRHLKNDRNRGLVFSLNRGVNEAKGIFLARMDADDIALPERFAKQLHYLQTNKTDIVATCVQLIDNAGHSLPDWQEDRDRISPDEIRRYLPINNCIAHPTVMGRTALFQQYPYLSKQKYSEDYDLWLRLLAGGNYIHKIEEPLLLYRVLPTSFTRSKKTNLFYGLAKVKFQFVRQQAKRGNLNTFVLSVFVYACLDLLKAAGKEIKTRMIK